MGRACSISLCASGVRCGPESEALSRPAHGTILLQSLAMSRRVSRLRWISLRLGIVGILIVLAAYIFNWFYVLDVNNKCAPNNYAFELERGGLGVSSDVGIREDEPIGLRVHLYSKSQTSRPRQYEWVPMYGSWSSSPGVHVAVLRIPYWLFTPPAAATIWWGRSRRKPGACPSCGYPLTGLRGATCPECGHDLPAAKQKCASSTSQPA
jgi:hypothetical protein